MPEPANIHGLRYEYQDVPFTSSQLGKEFAWCSLPQLGIQYDRERDMPELLKRATSLQVTDAPEKENSRT
jgi:hypothetical protein